MVVGAILTQSTAWVNVEKAIANLKLAGVLSVPAIEALSLAELAGLVRPSGYFWQKAKKLKIFARFSLSLSGRAPAREELLALWGVGPETADSILLYAYGQPSFVVDAYTRRILEHHKMIKKSATYEEIKEIFEQSLPRDIKTYQEYHALIVEHAKRMKAGGAAPLERIM
jgi:endonuclease-3 related protein